MLVSRLPVEDRMSDKVMDFEIIGNEVIGRVVGKSNQFPKDLDIAIQDVYELSGIMVLNITIEAESAEYGACRFVIDGHNAVFRVAKTTPTKIGQFVTLWKRPTTSGIIAPLDISDGIDFVVVCVSDGATHWGQFIFDQKILVSKGIMSKNCKGGKRAIRIYPPWTKPVAKDAVKTQLWQLPYFVSCEPNGTVDSVVVRKLFNR